MSKTTSIRKLAWGLFAALCLAAGLFNIAAFPEPAAADDVVLSSGRYTATMWDADGVESKAYYRLAGKAVVDEHGGKVSRAANAIAHGSLDSLGRATWSAGYITPTLWAKEASEGRETTNLPDPVGWRDNKQVKIELYDGKKAYSGYFYNRSHLVADSLGGDPIKENLVTGTRTQNVGANDGKGGMGYAETIARDYMTAHPSATLYYAATPVYVGSELVPRSVYVDMKSDDGSVDAHIEVYNTARGYYVNYADGSWGEGEPNSTRTGAPTPAELEAQESGPFTDVSQDTPHEQDVLWMASAGISTGFANGDGTSSFRPYASIARCDMAAFIYRVADSWGLVDPAWSPHANPFSDVLLVDTPHAREILWLAENGISEGWVGSNGTRTFRPYGDVARQDMAAFLFRLARMAGRGGASYSWQPAYQSQQKFSDVGAQAADNHHDEVWWLAEKGVAQGWSMPDGTSEFRGLLPVARCDMAAFLHRLAQLPAQ